MRAKSVAIVLALSNALCSGAHSAPVGARFGPPVTVLDGTWELNLARTHYGRGVDRRRREVFTCAPRGEQVHCVIRSVRADGRVLVGEFAASVDRVGAPVSSMAGVDEVQLSQSPDSVLDGTFRWHGQPVFGYRVFRSGDGRSLLIVSVDPITRVALTTVVVYDRR
jgi:hypothetical protein